MGGAARPREEIKVEQEYLTYDDIARLLGITVKTLRRMRHKGATPLGSPDALVDGRALYRRATVEHWLSTRRGPGRPKVAAPPVAAMERPEQESVSASEPDEERAEATG
jgi:hypothetical protein